MLVTFQTLSGVSFKMCFYFQNVIISTFYDMLCVVAICPINKNQIYIKLPLMLHGVCGLRNQKKALSIQDSSFLIIYLTLNKTSK